MHLLAIETSQRSGGVALYRDGEIVAQPLSPTSRHDDGLMPAIDAIVRGQGLRPSDLDAVGVSIGPGGFTGLRVAIATAKMLAETLGLRVAAVPTALVAAAPHAGEKPMLVALASKRESAWFTRVVRDGSWRIDGEPGLRDATSIELSDVATVIADEHLPDALRAAIDTSGVPIVAPELDAQHCAAIAVEMIERNDVTDALSLAPIYPRPPEAVRLFDQSEKRSPPR